MGMSLRIHSIDLYYGSLNVIILAQFRVYQTLLSVGEEGGWRVGRLWVCHYGCIRKHTLEASKGYALSCCM